MTGRAHPAVDDGRAAISDGEILADESIAIATLLRPHERLHSGRRNVSEVVLREHDAEAVLGSEAQAIIEPERTHAACDAFTIHRRNQHRSGAAADRRSRMNAGYRPRPDAGYRPRTVDRYR